MAVVDIYSTSNKYDVVYADPPWRNRKSGTKAKNNERYYPSMDVEDIKKIPVSEIASKGSILFIWACFPCLEDALEVMKAWGYCYYGLGFDWCKTSRKGTPKIGCGYYTRQNNEVCLIGVKSKQGRPIPCVKNIGCSILESPREHSRKPDVVREYISKIVGDVPKIELFARQVVDGWDCWGNEV